eukprot:4690676-Amphidinium_carterae.1
MRQCQAHTAARKRPSCPRRGWQLVELMGRTPLKRNVAVEEVAVGEVAVINSTRPILSNIVKLRTLASLDVLPFVGLDKNCSE